MLGCKCWALHGKQFMINKLVGSKEGGGAFSESFNSGARVGSIHPDTIDLRTDVKVIKLFFFVTRESY